MKRFSLFHSVKQFSANQQGSVLIVVGVCFLFLVAIGGAAYDLGRQQLVRMKLQQASDAAALAGALLPIGTSPDDRRTTAQRYFSLNYPATYLGVSRPTPTITVTNTVQVVANTELNTSFVNNFGVMKMKSKGDSTTVISGLNIDYDVVMVVDESSSTLCDLAEPIMLGGVDCPKIQNLTGKTRFGAIKRSILRLIDIIYPAGPPNQNVRFGLIGYSAHIGDKYGLTSNKGQAIAAVNNMTAFWANYDHYGLRAGYNMITGNTTSGIANGRTVCGVNYNWSDASFNHVACAATENTQVPPPRTSRPDGEKNSKVKNLILLTDGYIMLEPPPCLTGGSPCPNYPAFLAECSKLKAADVTVFTISFVSQTPGDEATLKSCASVDPSTGKPRYFYAPDAATLDKVLMGIGTTITKVRIIQ